MSLKKLIVCLLGIVSLQAADNRSDVMSENLKRQVAYMRRSWGDRRLVQALNEEPRVSDIGQLLAQGADPNEIDEDDMSALIWATLNGLLDDMDVLIAAGADVNRVDNQGVTALAQAVFNNDQEAIIKLLQAGADPDYVLEGFPEYITPEIAQLFMPYYRDRDVGNMADLEDMEISNQAAAKIQRAYRKYRNK